MSKSEVKDLIYYVERWGEEMSNYIEELEERIGRIRLGEIYRVMPHKNT